MTLVNSKPQFDRGDRIAEAVSVVFHPFVVVVPTMVVAMMKLGSTLAQSLFWTLLSIGLVNLPVMILIYVGVRSGRYSDPSVSMREQRKSLYVIGGFFMLLLLTILAWSHAPLILIGCLTSAILATLVGFMINQRFTKLSLHSVGIAGCTTVLLLIFPILGIVMVLFMPLVGWARIRLKHHTPLQILIGWIVSALCVLMVFRIFHLIL